MARTAKRQYGEGTILKYRTKAGIRYRAMWYDPVDPEDPSAGSRRMSAGGFTTKRDASDHLLDESHRVWWRLSILGRMMRVMAAPRKYSVELQQRATRMAMDARKDPESARGAIKRIADQLGVHPEALRNWVRQAEIDGGVRPGVTTDEATRLAELEREVRELRRANEMADSSGVCKELCELL